MTAGHQKLTRALVVVDSRNIFHQTEDATGYRVLPTVDGIVAAMADYGFDAVQVHVGLALPRKQDRSQLSVAGAENELYRQSIESTDRGTVLLGELHRKERDRGIEVEEKQVDVACAVDICRHATLMSHRESKSGFEAIVVLSQDTDLKPAFDYAREVNVPLVIAANARIERRGFDYLLLTEHSFRKMARLRTPLVGHAMRAAVAKAVIAPDQFFDWKILGWDSRRERLLVERHDGVRGVVKPNMLSSSNVGEVVKLRVAGVDFGRRRNDFPLATCTPKGPHPQQDHRTKFETRVVRGRRGPGEVLLDKDVHGKARLDYPPGGVATGTPVLVDSTEVNRPLVVGPLVLPPGRTLVQAEPLCVVPVKHHTETATFAATKAQGRVLISHSKGRPPEIGKRYAAVLVETGSKAVAKLISSPLP